jgi:hypothetical protein
MSRSYSSQSSEYTEIPTKLESSDQDCESETSQENSALDSSAIIFELQKGYINNKDKLQTLGVRKNFKSPKVQIRKSMEKFLDELKSALEVASNEKCTYGYYLSTQSIKFLC